MISSGRILARSLSRLVIVGLAFAWGSANAGDAEADEESADKSTAVAPSESKTAESTKAASKEFVPPPGFKKKTRGKFVVYCILDSTVGTRFKTEKCYDEEQMKAYLLARELNNRDFDQRRAVCSNPAVCAQ